MNSMTIKIPNVSESLEEKLEALVLGGAFWPDQPLVSERKLAEEFDVSRTSLRTALSNLCKKGLIRLEKRHHVTNVMADLLCPGFLEVAKSKPHSILDYWLLLFQEASSLASKKARTSDRVLVQKCAKEFKKHVAGESPQDAARSFEQLTRAVFDSCYNFFLSQTHHAIYLVSAGLFENSIHALCRRATDDASVITEIGEIGHLNFNVESWRAYFAEDFALIQGQVFPKIKINGVTANQLLDVTLRHSVAFESVYELRLITEKHAAYQAAKNITPKQKRLLAEHLERMTVTADISPTDYSSLDTELHQMLAQYSQNSVFSVIDAALSPVFSRTTNQWLKKHMEMRTDQSNIHLQHTQIAEAVVEGDGEAAQAAMKEHLAYVLRNLRYLREQDHLHEIATARRLLSEN